MRRVSSVVGLLAAVFLAAPVYAEDRSCCPQRETLEIRSSGSARATVALDSFTIVFGLETESDSFGAAFGDARGKFDAIRRAAQEAGLPGVRERYEFAAVGQSGLSFGRSGSSLRHRYEIRAEGLAPGGLHSAVIALIDAALDLDDDLYVVDMNAHLSAPAAAALRKRLMEEAAAAALANARRIAEGAGGQVGAPRSLNWSAPHDDFAGPGDGDAIDEIVVTATKREFVRARESFELDYPFPAEVSRSASVSGAWELLPGAPEEPGAAAD